jgi:hypothetical protein
MMKKYRKENEEDEGDGAIRCTYHHPSLTKRYSSFSIYCIFRM